MAFIAFITANASLLIGAVVVLLNVLVAVFKKNTKVSGILSLVRGIVERFAVLEPRDSAGTVKVPGKAASEPPIMG